MSPDHFEIHNCLTLLEEEINAQMEAEEKEAAMQLGHELLDYPEFVPQDMVPGWLSTEGGNLGRGRR